MTGAIVFVAADSVHRVDMKIEDLMKIYLSIGIMSSTLIPDQYIFAPDELEPPKDRLVDTHSEG
jgi:uncharacterized membrane protein